MMSSAGTEHPVHRPRATWQAGRWAVLFAAWLLAGVLALLAAPAARAAGPELSTFELVATDEGLLLNYAVDFELSRAVEDALNKSVPLYFVAEAELFRDRWYWRDRRVAKATRVWRVVFQPLTYSYRVTFDGLSQNYPNLPAAMAAIRSGARWKIAERSDVEDGSRHYVEFSFRLDTTLLPRPMQIGLSGQPDWTLNVERVQRLP